MSDLDECFRRGPWDHRGGIHLDPKPPKPTFTHEILNRFVNGGPLHPVPEGASLLLRGDPVRLHVEPKPLGLQGRGQQKVGADRRGIDLAGGEVIPDPGPKSASRPRFGIGHADIVRPKRDAVEEPAERQAAGYDSPVPANPPGEVRLLGPSPPRLEIRPNVTTEFRLENIADRLRESNAFATVVSDGTCIRCRARDVESDAYYVFAVSDTRPSVRFETPDRWLSESVEAELYHSSDSLEELLEESLDELEWPIERVPVTTFRHFRSDDFLYTFENDVPIGEGDPDEAAAIWMLAYEATFRALGDVAGETEDE